MTAGYGLNAPNRNQRDMEIPQRAPASPPTTA